MEDELELELVMKKNRDFRFFYKTNYFIIWMLLSRSVIALSQKS